MVAMTDMNGNHITITITPSLSPEFLDGERLKTLVHQGRFQEFFFGIMEEIRLLEVRLDKHLTVLSEILQKREWRNDALNHIGELILDYALDNAMHGYSGTRSISNYGSNWEDRSELTKKLYKMIREHHFGSNHDPEHPGLTAGEGKLFDSLRAGDDMNIFEVRPDAGKVVVGSKFEFASLLENGGFRSSVPESNLGITRDKKSGRLRATQWLVKAMGGDQLAADLMVHEILDADKQMPPRPYLKPALWTVKDDEWALTIIAQVFGDMLFREMCDFSPMWSSVNDVVNIAIHASRVVTGPEI